LCSENPLRKIGDYGFCCFAFEGSVRHEFFIFPNQTGTATSSPTHTTASQTDINIVNTMLWIPVIAETDEEIKQAIQDDCILVCQANGKTYFKKPAWKNENKPLFLFLRSLYSKHITTCAERWF
jgi:hypothetical protein